MVLCPGGENKSGKDLLYDSSSLPCPDREDTMYLNVMRPKDVPMGPVRFFRDDNLSLRTHDIRGAQAKTKYSSLYVDGKAEKEEPEGSKPKQYFIDVRRRPDMSLRTCDIDKATPNAAMFKTSRQCNPLEPCYDLPTFRERPITPPMAKFHEGVARDTLTNKGHAKSKILERDYARNPCEQRDIEFSQPNMRTRLKNLTPRESLRTVEQAGARIISSKYCSTPRDTNPIDPVYTVDTRTTHPFRRSEGETLHAPREHGRIPGCTPRQLHRDNGEPQASLIRSDIAGAVSQRYKGCMPFNIYDAPEITPFSGHMQLDCSDIDGTQTGTRKP